jgi:hypothetical protein
MKSKKLLLTIKDLKDLGLIGKRKKKSRRKRKADKKLGANSVISGVRSEFIGPTFGTQINRTTDLQNENIRLQNEKLLENVKNSENQTKLLLALANENEDTQTVNQWYNYLQSTEQGILNKLTGQDPEIQRDIDGLAFLWDNQPQLLRAYISYLVLSLPWNIYGLFQVKGLIFEFLIYLFSISFACNFYFLLAANDYFRNEFFRMIYFKK